MDNSRDNAAMRNWLESLDMYKADLKDINKEMRDKKLMGSPTWERQKCHLEAQITLLIAKISKAEKKARRLRLKG